VRRRLLASTLAIAVAGLLVLGVPLAYVVDRLLRTEAVDRLERRAETIGLALSEEIESGAVDRARLSTLAPEGERVVLRLRDGTVVTAGAPIAGVVLAGRAPGPAGSTVRLESDEAPVARHVDRVLLGLEGLGATSLAVAVGLALLQGRRLAAPLEQLEVAAERVGAGDFSAATPRSGVPEIDAIADALDRSTARIARLVRAEREFSANASHQLRTVVTGLVLRLDELAASPDPTVRAEAEAALEQAERLTATIDELLRLARTGEAGEAAPFDLTALVAGHLEGWNRRLRAAGRSVVLVADGPVPVHAVSGAAGQALDVLLSNAERHGAGTVTVEVARDGEHGTVTVVDEGTGVAVAARPNLFDRRSTSEGGHGIGLALARTLVEADGGRIELVGARPAAFRIVLPLGES
jgi:signal transduction histidine kinase